MYKLNLKIIGPTSSNLSPDKLHWMSNHYTFLAIVLLYNHMISKNKHLLERKYCICNTVYVKHWSPHFFFLQMSFTWYAKLVLGKFIEIYQFCKSVFFYSARCIMRNWHFSLGWKLNTILNENKLWQSVCRSFLHSQVFKKIFILPRYMYMWAARNAGKLCCQIS